ncbi:hypothetical protein WAK64_06365 [Bacillus spongiae]|uniref:DUF2508 family protein n=1 Tax=Bacillus spongiae TaxID=2683610 RepID=A0ABU8HBN5_9BACI
MDEGRKNAYRILIYQAFLDIKNSVSQDECFHIAHAFHNLAESQINDFKKLDEETFWNRIQYLEIQFKLHHYRSLFEKSII